jgi:hypothetical protein
VIHAIQPAGKGNGAMRLIVAVLFITAVGLPTSASAKVKKLTYNEAYRAATDFAKALVPGGPPTTYNPTGYSLSPCERVSPIKFHCRDVLFYEDGPDTHLTISVQRVKSGGLNVSTHFPPVKRLTYDEAYQTASGYADDLIPGPSSNLGAHRVTGSDVDSCKRLSRIKFHCRAAVHYNDVPDCRVIIGVQRVKSGRLMVSARFLDSCPNLGR